MTKYIRYRECDSPYCKGCNLKNLEMMLRNGKFDCIMNENHCINTTAEVAPVVHGRWDGNDCTVCKLPWNYNMVQDADDWGYFDPMPKYCPNCGAKMDECNEPEN